MEWKLLLRKKKMIGILVGLFIFQIFVFLYSAQKELTDTKEEDVSSYTEEFYAHVQSVVQQADAMGGISLFTQADSFTGRNLEKTKNDFERLFSVKPVEFENRFLTEFFNCSMINGIVVLCGVIIAFAYVEENKPGLRSMIFSAANGRGKLAAQKIGALFLWSAVITVVFYGGTLAASVLFYGGSLMEGFGYPIQSLPIFMDLPWLTGIGEFLICYLIYRCMVLFLIVLIIWTVMLCIDNLLMSVGLVGFMGILNYLLYYFIGSNHPLNILRYCNLWYQSTGIGFFTEYKNLNIMSYAVNKNVVMIGGYLLCVFIFGGAALLAGSRKYPCASRLAGWESRVEKLSKRMKKLHGNIMERLSLTGMEFYKVLISQKGMIVILLLAVILLWISDFKNLQLSGQQELYYEFLEEYTGVPNAESQQEIKELEDMLAAVEAEYLEDCKLYEQGILSTEDSILSTMRYDSFANDRKFLEQIQEQTAYLENLKEEKGISGWYVNVYSYHYLLREDNVMWNLLLIMGVVLLCSGIFSLEKKCGTLSIVRGSREGRKGVFKKKIQTAFVLTACLFLMTMALELGITVYIYGLEGLAAPVQSIPKLSFVSIRCSIGVFFAGLYLVKGIMLSSVAALTSMFSARTSQKAAIALAFLICIPALLAMVGFDFFRYLSLIEVLSVAPFLVQTGSVGIVTVVSLIFLLAGSLSIRDAYKRWCYT